MNPSAQTCKDTWLPPLTARTQLEEAILLLISSPLVTPDLHPFPAAGVADIDRRYDLVDSQCAAEHGQLPETAVLTVRYTEATRPTPATRLRLQVFHGECALPVV